MTSTTPSLDAFERRIETAMSARQSRLEEELAEPVLVKILDRRVERAHLGARGNIVGDDPRGVVPNRTSWDLRKVAARSWKTFCT